MRLTSSPYRLYALSNLGSLLGLLTYPFLVEPLLTVRFQSVFWFILYGGFLFVCSWCAISLFKTKTEVVTDKQSQSQYQPEKLSNKFLWLSLSACGSIMLLAMTNQICQEVAVIPFLWILPLSLYLLSFIICFEKERWYVRAVWIPLFFLTLSGSLFLLNKQGETNLILQILLFSATLFASCMVCHGELVRLKPHPSRLTFFYLMVALGGALGGVFVNLVSPLLFTGYWELHVGLAGTLLLLWICTFKQVEKSTVLVIRYFGREARALIFCVILIFLGRHIYRQQAGTLMSSRSFYGVVHISDYDVNTENWLRYLWHNQIVHGNQFIVDTLRHYGTTYYGPESGIAIAITHHPQRLAKASDGVLSPQDGLRVAVIGLGAGTIATYTKEGDVLRFYEINPDVVHLSKNYFYYLSDSQAETEIVLGDARLSLEGELHNTGSQQYDIIALDAFSGDAIPIHLLTREAFELYWKHLRNDGILAVHTSNLHLELGRVVRGIAHEIGKSSVLISNEDDENFGVMNADWIIVTNNRFFLNNNIVEDFIEPWPEDMKKTVVWTDNFSNLISLLY